jgi:hypothetical protein
LVKVRFYLASGDSNYVISAVLPDAILKVIRVKCRSLQKQNMAALAGEIAEWPSHGYCDALMASGRGTKLAFWRDI